MCPSYKGHLPNCPTSFLQAFERVCSLPALVRDVVALALACLGSGMDVVSDPKRAVCCPSPQTAN